MYTFDMTATMTVITGSMTETTKASFQLIVKATIYPTAKVLKLYRKSDNLSPIPARIFSTSLLKKPSKLRPKKTHAHSNMI